MGDPRIAEIFRELIALQQEVLDTQKRTETALLHIERLTDMLRTVERCDPADDGLSAAA